MQRLLATATLGAALAFASQVSGGTTPLDPVIDGDQDGIHDDVEFYLGSDSGNPASTPEHPIVPDTCLDGLDNDADGLADLVDPSCAPLPPPFDSTFPGAGLDMFESTMNLAAYDFDIGGGNICTIDLQAEGPTVVDRQDPTDIGGGQMQIDVEIVAMQLTGSADFLGGSGCPIPAGAVTPLTFYHAGPSMGQVTERNPPDPTTDFPADSYFQVQFTVEIPGLAPFPGGPPGGPAGDPVLVENVINTLPPYHGGMNPNCYQVAGLEHLHCPKAPPDHYLCYKSKFDPKFAKRDAMIQDQFDPAAVQHRVTKPTWFCNPAAKNTEPLYEETGHLKCYKMKKQKQKQIVTVRNQFGISTVETKKSEMICLPTEKDGAGAPTTLDNYQCYKSKFTPKFDKRDVTMFDQWQASAGQVKKPLFLCNPASLDGSGIVNPTRHLACYKFKAPKFQQTATASNAFGDEQVLAKKPVAVCVPSSKSFDDGSPPPPPGKPLLAYGVQHGMGMSDLCYAVTGGQPNAMVTMQLGGPKTFLPQDVQLDGSGEVRGNFTIFQFGGYLLQASILTTPQVDLTLPLTVDASNVPCP